jgi:septum formation protein
MAAPFVLASGSPRRRELLERAGIEFEVSAPRVDERATPELTIRELTVWNATRKALAVARLRPAAIVLGADTLVALAGEVLGKPADLGEARRFLRRLSGREHEVCTGVFVCAEGGKRRRSFHVFTHVQFRTLNEPEIDSYLAKVNPLDKAGGYAAQGHGAEIIAAIHGSYTNVVGLPMDETLAALAEFGIEPNRA